MFAQVWHEDKSTLEDSRQNDFLPFKIFVDLRRYPSDLKCANTSHELLHASRVLRVEWWVFASVDSLRELKNLRIQDTMVYQRSPFIWFELTQSWISVEVSKIFHVFRSVCVTSCRPGKKKSPLTSLYFQGGIFVTKNARIFVFLPKKIHPKNIPERATS